MKPFSECSETKCRVLLLWLITNTHNLFCPIDVFYFLFSFLKPILVLTQNPVKVMKEMKKGKEKTIFSIYQSFSFDENLLYQDNENVFLVFFCNILVFISIVNLTCKFFFDLNNKEKSWFIHLNVNMNALLLLVFVCLILCANKSI